MTKPQEWFLSLKAGDRVMALFPWQDARVPGGRRVLATVGRQVPNQKLRTFHYRRADGSRASEATTTPVGGVYFKVYPVGSELVFQPSRGYIFRQHSRPLLRRAA